MPMRMRPCYLSQAKDKFDIMSLSDILQGPPPVLSCIRIKGTISWHRPRRGLPTAGISGECVERHVMGGQAIQDV